MSKKLRKLFFVLEIAMFEEWKKADKKGRDKLCKELGEWEGKEIIKEINEQCLKNNRALKEIKK